MMVPLVHFRLKVTLAYTVEFVVSGSKLGNERTAFVGLVHLLETDPYMAAEAGAVNAAAESQTLNVPRTRIKKGFSRMMELDFIARSLNDLVF